MRRARIALALVTLALVFCAPGAARAAQTVSRMNGVGILDYTLKPTFKVGDYVSYVVTNYDENGDPTDHYNLTLLIAGQEEWWGERCFFVETWVDDGQKQRSSAATLMGYGIFDDTLAVQHLQMWMRKTVMGYDTETEALVEVLVAPKQSSLTARSTASKPHIVERETLGVDTVQTPVGLLHARKVAQHQSWGNTGGIGDSTVYKELHENRTLWLSDDVPMTRLARDETENTETRRAWLIGRSRDVPASQPIAKTVVVARLLGYGHGLKSRILPPDRVHSFDDPPAPKKPVPHAMPRKIAGGARRK
jgi:hypothetical protein